MSQQSQQSLDKEICVLICPISAGMLGVCMTTIGIIRIVINTHNVSTFADDLLCFDATMFLISTLTSYIALRTRNIRRIHWLENIADRAFMTAMTLMVAVCLFITYLIS